MVEDVQTEDEWQHTDGDDSDGEVEIRFEHETESLDVRVAVEDDAVGAEVCAED